jgi:hypothetical protein
MGRACSIHGRERKAYRVLVGEPEVKRPLRKPNIRGRIIIKWSVEE